MIAPDNTVVVGGRLLQIERQPGRRTYAGLRVLVRQQLDGRITVIRPPDVPLRYTVVTPDTLVPVPPPSRVITRRPRRKTGLGRWPKPEVLFPSRVPKGADHVSTTWRMSIRQPSQSGR